jgi:hypothetical protein
LRNNLPFEETPAPISISGSSMTWYSSMGIPPVPPCSALMIHLRSASVSTWMGTTLMPVLKSLHSRGPNPTPHLVFRSQQDTSPKRESTYRTKHALNVFGCLRTSVHGCFCINGIRSIIHLHKSVSLVSVDCTALYTAISAEYHS